MRMVGQLYEQICDLPEYYPYRAEQDILATYATEIHAAIGHLSLSLASETPAKHAISWQNTSALGQPFLYCPVDIAR